MGTIQEVTRSRGSVIGLMHLPAFRRLVLAQATSEVGNWMTNVALILLLFRLLEHPAVAGMVLVAKLLPRALVYPIGGLLADLVDRRLLMIGSDLVRAGLALSLLLVQDPAQAWWVLIATALAQAVASIFTPTAMALVPGVVPAERLGPANALLGAVKEIAFFIGPLLGTLVIVVGDVGLVFVLDAVTFLLSAVLLSGMTTAARPAIGRRSLQIRRDLLLGWATVRRQGALAILFAAQATFGILIAALNVLLVPLLIAQWHAPEALLGTLYAAVGAGSLAGSLIAFRIPPARYIGITLMMLALIGASTVALGLTTWVWLGALVLAVIGTATMVGDIASYASIQANISDDRLGRIFGLLFWVIAVGQAGGALLGWAASTLSPTLLVIALGAAVLVTTLLLARRWVSLGRAAEASAPPHSG